MKRVYFVALILILFASFEIFCQAPRHFKAEAKASKLILNKGEEFQIKLIVEFEKGWNTYSMKEQLNKDGVGPLPTEIKLEPQNLIKRKGKIITPKPKIKYDPGFEMKVEIYKGKVEFIIPAVAQRQLDLNKDKIYVILTMQQCDNKICLPAEDFKIPVSNGVVSQEDSAKLISPIDTLDKDTSKITKKGTDAQLNKGNPVQEGEKDEKSSEKEGMSLLSIILFGMAAGGAALLTPCVFPMVPITVSFFTKRLEQKKTKGLRDASIYALGIILTFTSIGFFFSLIFGASGLQDFVNSPGVSIAIAVIFIIFAISLFGVFELQLPPSLLNKLNAKSQSGSGIGSVIFMAMTFSFASFSCTGPLLGAALVSAAKGEWFYPIVSMLSFSTVLAAPFFLLALFPKALTSLPKSGAWMNNIKGVLAFLLLAVSLKFIDSALVSWELGFSRELFLSIWIGCFLLVALYILGIFILPHDAPVQSVGVMRIIFALAFLTLAFYSLSGLFGNNLGFLEAYVPAPTAKVSANVNNTSEVINQSQQTEVWLDNYEQALNLAKSTNQNIFVDFTGKHCVNCRLMERTMFTKASVSELMNKMIKVKLITDVREEPYISNKNLQMQKFNSVAIPLYVILDKNENVIAKMGFTNSEEEFLNFLRKGVK